jgi:hypothetical protein
MISKTRSRHASGFLFLGALLGIIGFVAGCKSDMNHSHSPKRDINIVLAAHDRELLALPGVVGVYVGLLPDGKSPCLKVMLVKPDKQLEKSIPQKLEGYPVVTEVTGEIRPMSKP